MNILMYNLTNDFLTKFYSDLGKIQYISVQPNLNSSEKINGFLLFLKNSTNQITDRQFGIFLEVTERVLNGNQVFLINISELFKDTPEVVALTPSSKEGWNYLNDNIKSIEIRSISDFETVRIEINNRLTSYNLSSNEDIVANWLSVFSV